MRLFEIIKNLSLNIKLNVLAFLIFSFLLLGMLLSTNNSMNGFVSEAGHQGVTQDTEIVQLRFGEIEQETLNNAIAISNLAGLSDAVTAGNIQPIQADVLIAGSRLGFDDVDVVNITGKGLMDTDNAVSKDEERLTTLALLGFETTGLIVTNKEGQEKAFIASVVPIHDASGATVGAVLGSRLIDNKLLAKVNVFSGHDLELALIVNGHIVANDFDTTEDLDYFSAYLLNPSAVEQALNGQTVISDQLINDPEGTPHALGQAPLTIGSGTGAVIGIAVHIGEFASLKSRLIANQRGIFAVFAIIGNIIFAFFAWNSITTPLRRLKSAAEQLANGNYEQRMHSRTKDEIGQLNNSFNTMASQIQSLVTTLEDRVKQRTTELENRSTELEQIAKQSEKRANELLTIEKIAGYLSTEKELENLLPLITQTVSERFGYYHVGIFLLNENRKFAVLRAANSIGGQKMLEKQHKLEVGQVGIVGNVTSMGKPRIALDTGTDAVHFNNPDLPETHSEMALPLIARGTIIGALDVQSTIPNAFTDEDVTLLSLLADQIAIAIDNARLLKDSQNALEESQSVFSEYLAEAWQKRSTSGILGYHQTLAGGQLITGKTIKESDMPVGTEKNTLTVPISLRDQVIGTLNIRPNNIGRTWSADEVNIVQAVVERLGLALDNARLFEETSSRASRESLVSDITTKIRGTNDPEEMIKTAVEELKRALAVTRIEIIPQKVSPPPDK